MAAAWLDPYSLSMRLGWTMRRAGSLAEFAQDYALSQRISITDNTLTRALAVTGTLAASASLAVNLWSFTDDSGETSQIVTLYDCVATATGTAGAALQVKPNSTDPIPDWFFRGASAAQGKLIILPGEWLAFGGSAVTLTTSTGKIELSNPGTQTVTYSVIFRGLGPVSTTTTTTTTTP